MIQEIITYIILASTFCFILFKMFYRKIDKNKNICGDCKLSCSERKMIKKVKKY